MDTLNPALPRTARHLATMTAVSRGGVIRRAKAAMARWERIATAYANRGQFREAHDADAEVVDLAELIDDLLS